MNNHHHYFCVHFIDISGKCQSLDKVNVQRTGPKDYRESVVPDSDLRIYAC